MDILDDVAELAGRDILELLSLAVEMLVDFDGRLLKHAMCFLRTAREQEIGAAHDSFLVVFGIKREAEHGGLWFFSLQSARFHRVQLV